MERYKNFFISRFNGTAKFASLNYSDWDSVLKMLPYVPVGYTLESLNYQCSYISAFVEDLVDLSVVLYQNGKEIGIWPVSLRKVNGCYELCTNQGAVLPPIYISGTSERMIKKYNNMCIRGICEFYEYIKDEMSMSCEWTTTVSFLPSGVLLQNILWDKKCMSSGGHVQVLHDLYVDMALSLEEIHKRLRKSYRSLLHEGEKLWTIDVHDTVSKEIFDEFRLLHRDVAGRVTRSQNTWDLQFEAINHSDDFLITIRDNEQKLRGGGLFETSKTEGSYAVGAYDRALFDKPVSHIVQWTAIKHLKALGKRWHYVGQRFYAGDIPKPTSKELQIAYFKEGFATDTALRLLLKMNFENRVE